MRYTVRKTKRGWSLFVGRKLAFTTRYRTRREAEERVAVEAMWEAYLSSSLNRLHEVIHI